MINKIKIKNCVFTTSLPETDIEVVEFIEKTYSDSFQEVVKEIYDCHRKLGETVLVSFQKMLETVIRKK